MQVDVIVVGGGLCGTFLSWFLAKEGVSFVVIDEENANSASRVSAGVINPVTGRRFVQTWMIKELMAFALESYQEMEKVMERPLLSEKPIIDFFTTPQMRNAFVERITENDTYLHSYPDQNLFNPHFNYDFGCGQISPVYVADVQQAISSWRRKLSSSGKLIEETFSTNELQENADGITYRDITARKLVFCDGASGAQNHFFSLLPYALNKGEMLVIKCTGLPNKHVAKKGMMLVPLAEEHTFWLGSSYQWEYTDADPSDAFYKAATQLLDHWLKHPYKVLQHQASLRPATVERRPFVGFHPHHPTIGLLNGMGTKGASLAPFFAHQLVQNMVHNLPISPEADVRRFSRILSRGI